MADVQVREHLSPAEAHAATNSQAADPADPADTSTAAAGPIGAAGTHEERPETRLGHVRVLSVPQELFDHFRNLIAGGH